MSWILKVICRLPRDDIPGGPGSSMDDSPGVKDAGTISPRAIATWGDNFGLSYPRVFFLIYPRFGFKFGFKLGFKFGLDLSQVRVQVWVTGHCGSPRGRSNENSLPLKRPAPV